MHGRGSGAWEQMLQALGRFRAVAGQDVLECDGISGRRPSDKCKLLGAYGRGSASHECQDCTMYVRTRCMQEAPMRTLTRWIDAGSNVRLVARHVSLLAGRCRASERRYGIEYRTSRTGPRVCKPWQLPYTLQQRS